MRRPLPMMDPPPQPGSLAEALAALPDPRQPFGWRGEYPPVPLAALVQVAVAAMLCGSVSLNAMAQWVRERVEDDPDLLTALGLPAGRTLCVATFHRVFKALDVAAFERVVGQWLQRTGVAATDAVSVDGKVVRGVAGAHLVSLYAQQAGVVIAQLRTAGVGHELAGARTLLTAPTIAGRVVTGDALSANRSVCRQVVAAGGDYLVPVDANQPTLLADLETVFSPVAADRSAGMGTTAGAGLATGGVGRGRGAAGRGDRAGADPPARSSGGADGVGAGRPGPEPVRRQRRCGRAAVAASGPSLSGGTPSRGAHDRRPGHQGRA